MIYYIFVLISAVLFSLQFLCQQSYEKCSGTKIDAALGFSAYKGLSITILMLIISGFKIEFTLFSLFASGIYALCYILMIYFSLKAFSVANLSVYSVFTMLGGMMIPFITGIALFNEKLTPLKLICCVLVIVAVLMTIKRGSSQKKAHIYYALVFIFNGSIGAVSAIHQNLGIPHTNSTSFMFYSGIWTILLCALWLGIQFKKPLPVFRGRELFYSAGDGFLNGVGDLLLLISVAPGALDASVQYPFVTGGVMVFSTIISTLRRERVRKIEYLSTVVAFIAAVLMAF